MTTVAGSNFVMVYGTLKRGEPNHHWMLDKGTAEFIGLAETITPYPLVIASKYNIPMLMDVAGKGRNVKGEVYKIDGVKLSHLDVLEDYPKLYTRRLEKVRLLNEDKIIEAVVYFVRKYKPEMLESPFLSDYSSYGDHKRPYHRWEDQDHDEKLKIVS